MKRQLLKILVIGLILMGSFSFAQPILTAAGLNPIINENVTFFASAYMDPGNGGANQAWNLIFSNNTSGGLSTCVTPGSTTKGSSFPNANLAINNPSNSTVVYYKTSNSAFQSYGTVAGTAGTVLSYSDPEDLLRFPFTMNSSYSDNWATKYVSAGNTYYRTGTTTVTADGYGTITTPTGIYTNALRVHFEQEYQDSTQVFGDPLIIEYFNDQYIWYKEGIHFALASVFELTSDINDYDGGNYLGGTIGIDAQSDLNVRAKIFPNPFNEAFNVLAEESASYTLYSLAGQVVKSGDLVYGNNQISTSELAKGSYLLKVGNTVTFLVK